MARQTSKLVVDDDDNNNNEGWSLLYPYDTRLPGKLVTPANVAQSMEFFDHLTT